MQNFRKLVQVKRQVSGKGGMWIFNSFMYFSMAWYLTLWFLMPDFQRHEVQQKSVTSLSSFGLFDPLQVATNVFIVLPFIPLDIIERWSAIFLFRCSLCILNHCAFLAMRKVVTRWQLYQVSDFDSCYNAVLFQIHSPRLMNVIYERRDDSIAVLVARKQFFLILWLNLHRFSKRPILGMMKYFTAKDWNRWQMTCNW